MSSAIKIVCCGDAGVGKTWLVMNLSQKPAPSDYRETLEETKIAYTISEKLVNIHEVGGRTYNLKWNEDRKNLFFAGSTVVLIVYDILSEQTFHSATQRYFRDVKNYVPNTFIMLIGTKTDAHLSRAVTIKEAEKFASRNQILFMEVSNPLKTNIELTRRIIQIRVEHHVPSPSKSKLKGSVSTGTSTPSHLASQMLSPEPSQKDKLPGRHSVQKPVEEEPTHEDEQHENIVPTHAVVVPFSPASSRPTSASSNAEIRTTTITSTTTMKRERETTTPANPLVSPRRGSPGRNLREQLPKRNLSPPRMTASLPQPRPNDNYFPSQNNTKSTPSKEPTPVSTPSNGPQYGTMILRAGAPPTPGRMSSPAKQPSLGKERPQAAAPGSIQISTPVTPRSKSTKKEPNSLSRYEPTEDVPVKEEPVTPRSSRPDLSYRGLTPVKYEVEEVTESKVSSVRKTEVRTIERGQTSTTPSRPDFYSNFAEQRKQYRRQAEEEEFSKVLKTRESSLDKLQGYSSDPQTPDSSVKKPADLSPYVKLPSRVIVSNSKEDRSLSPIRTSTSAKKGEQYDAVIKAFQPTKDGRMVPVIETNLANSDEPPSEVKNVNIDSRLEDPGLYININTGNGKWVKIGVYSDDNVFHLAEKCVKESSLPPAKTQELAYIIKQSINKYIKKQNELQSKIASETERKHVATLRLNLGNGRKGTITVREGDDPAALAKQFVQEHKLMPEMTDIIESKIREQLFSHYFSDSDSSSVSSEPQREIKTPKKLLFTLEVDIGKNKTAPLQVYEGDDLRALARQFVRDNGISMEAERTLLDYLRQGMKRYESDK